MVTEPNVCVPCGFELDKPDRLGQFRQLLEHENDPLVLLTHLLRWCRDEHDVLWEHGHGSIDSEVHGLRSLYRRAGSASVADHRFRRAMAAALDTDRGIPPVVVARSLAVLLDEIFWPTFRESFLRRSPYQPSVGDPIPLDSPDVRDLTDMTPTTPPWRLANRLDETRHVRLAGEWAVQVRVVFDYSAADALSGLITPETVVATCHPNRSTTELSLTDRHSETLFPVLPCDPEQQVRTINELIDAACTAGASIVVLPELATTKEIADELEAWVRRDDGPNLVVAGSYHHETTDMETGTTRRANTAVAWLRGHADPLTHDKHSPGDRPSGEGIQPQGWPELRVHVGADGSHLVVAICRDLLNPSAVHALSEVGANLVLVPAMSETLTPFVGSAANLVSSGQALVAVSNNPALWAHSEAARPTSRPARALFGHPGLGQLTRLVEPDDPSPGVALMRVSSGQLTWLPLGSNNRAAARQPTRPKWVDRLASAVCMPDGVAEPPGPGVGQGAAVLILLSEQGGEPCVLLTGRAAGLSRYPGRAVFPGGMVEPSDASVTATAVREAWEETGLDPSHLEILGVMSPMALPEDHLIVHPVLGWHDQYDAHAWSVNYAEVDSLIEAPLSQLAASRSVDTASHPSGLSGAEMRPLGPLGHMTRAIVDRLLGAALRVGIFAPGITGNSPGPTGSEVA